jgi:predicted DNA-binding ribbon-helix-helix protein
VPQRNKRSLTVAGHRTSISLEDEFWTALAEIAEAEGKSVPALVAEIDKRRSDSGASSANLSAAIRLYVLGRLRAGS